MKKVLKGGTVVGGSGSIRADVLIDGEKVAAVGIGEEMEHLADESTQIVDVEGCLLFPGFIGAHVHFSLHVAGTATADDFATGTRTTIWGGTTIIVDFGTQHEGKSLTDGLRNWYEKADGKCSCDYGFHIFISDWSLSVSGGLDDMMEAGITSFRLYVTYDTQVDDKTIFEILRRPREVGGITDVHCGNNDMIATLQTEAKAIGGMGVGSHPATRPAAAEAETVDRLLGLAEVVDIPVVMVHLTCREEYDMIMEARRRGQKVYTETCPQYLLMDDSLYELVGMEGTKYVCAPPLGKREGSACLWKALTDGTIQTVSADHCSFTTEQEALGGDGFTKIPGGVPGVEARGTLLYTYGIDARRITKKKVCQLLPENLTKLYGMYPTEGAIAPGSDADIVVMRTGAEDMITAADQVQNMDYTPFEGEELTAHIESVFLRSTQMMKDHQVVMEKAGKFVKYGRYGL